MDLIQMFIALLCFNCRIILKHLLTSSSYSILRRPHNFDEIFHFFWFWQLKKNGRFRQIFDNFALIPGHIWFLQSNVKNLIVPFDFTVFRKGKMRLKITNISFFKSSNIWSRKDICSKSKNVSFGGCFWKLRSFINQVFTVCTYYKSVIWLNTST